MTGFLTMVNSYFAPSTSKDSHLSVPAESVPGKGTYLSLLCEFSFFSLCFMDSEEDM
jgi:hypothetical protein